jgi:hypothetical protein
LGKLNAQEQSLFIYLFCSCEDLAKGFCVGKLGLIDVMLSKKKSD